MAVSTPLSDYAEMVKMWDLPLTLYGGTREIRERGQEYLPKQPRESKEAYENRLAQSYLVNIFKKTIQSLVGQSFIRSVIVSNVPEKLKYLEDNFDGAGTSLTDFASQLFTDTLLYGKEHDLGDFPSVDTSRMNRAQFSQLKSYATRIDPRNVIGWRTDNSKGYDELVEVRVKEVEMTVNEIWEEDYTYRIKVFQKDRIDIWEWINHVDEAGDDRSEYKYLTTIPNTLGYIPINVTYGDKLGFFKAKSPLEDLAFLNLRHYQSSSDQNHILHIARVPFIFASGIDNEELEGLEIGSNRLVTASSPDAEMGYVEHTGAAIDAGRQDLEDLKSEMAMLGADLLLGSGSRPDRQTALAASIDHSQSLSIVQIILRGIEESIKNIYKTAGDYMRVPDADKVEVVINDSLGIPNEPNPIQSVVQLLTDLDFTEEAILRELKRRGLVSSTTKLEDLRIGEQRRNSNVGQSFAGEDSNNRDSNNESNNDSEESDTEEAEQT